MNQTTLSIVLGIVSNLITNSIQWSLRRASGLRYRKKLTQKLQSIAGEDAVAISIHVGAFTQAPIPDVKKFLKQHQPNIRTILSYRVPNTRKVDDPATFKAIIEDIGDLVEGYASGVLREVHFFPTGIVAFPFILGAQLSNWTRVVVYHKSTDGYIPLYEYSKELRNQGARTLPSVADWEVIDVETEAIVTNLYGKKITNEKAAHPPITRH